MHKGVPKPVVAAATMVVAVSLVVTSCTPAPPPTPPEPPVTKTMTYSIPPPPTVTIPTDLSSDQLYDLAVSQYRQFFNMVSQLEEQGGAARLPSSAKYYLMEPAWDVVERHYIDLHSSGNRYVGTPYMEIQHVAANDDAAPPEGTLMGIKTCELTQGAPMLKPDGATFQDGSPVIMNRHAYFKYDTDGRLKLFDIHGPGRVDTCPFD